MVYPGAAHMYFVLTTSGRWLSARSANPVHAEARAVAADALRRKPTALRQSTPERHGHRDHIASCAFC